MQITALLVTATLALTGGPPAIAHGRDVPAGGYRFSAELTMTGLPTADHERRDSSCSGALIAPRWLITAGHCFRDENGERVDRPVAERTTATVGRTDLDSRTGHQVTVVAVHQSPTADVALAEIDTAITDIEPLRLATAAPRTGEVVRLTGFGLTGGDESRVTTHLQTGQFTVTGVGDAFVAMTGRAPRPDTSACPHDSGGPYFRERPDGVTELVAVVSHGPICPHAGADLSGRTDNMADWINATVDGDPSRDSATLILGGLAVLLFGSLAGTTWAYRRNRLRSPVRPAHRR